MLQEDKDKKGKAEKYKQRKKEEQERKKIERDKKKKMEEDVGVVERRGKSKDTEISESTSTSDDDTATIPAQVLDSDCETETASRPFCQRQLPQRYRPDSENDGVLFSICELNEPEGMSSDMIFWVDCDVCGVWVHNVCGFGSNTASRGYKCTSC